MIIAVYEEILSAVTGQVLFLDLDKVDEPFRTLLWIATQTSLTFILDENQATINGYTSVKEMWHEYMHSTKEAVLDPPVLIEALVDVYIQQ